MLVNLMVKKWRNFKGKAVLSMIANGDIDDNPDNLFYVQKYDLHLKRAAVIFGDNGSGKTNFLDAISFVKSFVLKGCPPIERADEDSGRICIDFLSGGTIYTYTLAIHKGCVIREKLKKYIGRTNEGASADVHLIFERRGRELGFNGSKFECSVGIPFIKLFTEINEVDASNVRCWFNSVLSIQENSALKRELIKEPIFNGGNTSSQFQTNGMTLVIDDFGSSIHPRLVQGFIRAHMRRETSFCLTDTKQLIIATHSGLLCDNNIFRLDEMHVCNPNTDYGFSNLSEFEGIRDDENIRKSLIQGRFG